MPSRSRFALAALLAALCLARGAAAVELQIVASGFSAPVDIAHAGDSSGRLFVVQQTGQIRIIQGGRVLAAPFLDIGPLIVSGGERGLLGVAFHPNYVRNGFFYVNYTRRTDGATVIARYARSVADPNVAESSSAAILLRIPQPFANHNGGQLRFGPDGYLYIALGDGGSANDPGNRAQNLSVLLGKMLRIDVNSASPYAIPADNPFQSDGDPNTRGEIWAYGLRNPWRFSFDRLTGDLLIADVGQSEREEVNFQPSGAMGGTNYGWRVMEGSFCTGLGGGPPCFAPSLTLPILEYDHSQGCSITGGFRYRGARVPQLSARYVYGDLCSGRIWAATREPSGGWTTSQLLATDLTISTFGEDQAGELYVADYSSGVIYRIATEPGDGAARADFNRDANTDIVWQNLSTGAVSFWLMTGTRFLSSSSPGRVPDTAWRIAGTGDFNLDGHSDVVWQHLSSGRISAWLMDGTRLLAGRSFTPNLVSDTNWHIVTIGDFSSDGSADLIWQNMSTGRISAWLMNGTTFRSGVPLTPGLESDTDWRIVAAGDFNADGKPDLVWRNAANGRIRAWLMNGTSRESQMDFAPNQVSDTNWNIVGVGDFNADGKSDLMWQHATTGAIAAWLMDGLRLVSGANFNPGRVSDTNWNIRNH